jgi:heat shock protein HslJ
MLLPVLGACILSCSQFKSLRQEDVTITTWGWSLHTLMGKAIDLANFPNGAPHLTFLPEGELQVRTGCNSLPGRFVVRDQSIYMMIAPAVKPSCTNSEESDFLRALKSSNRYVLGKDKLYLVRDTTVLMSFFPK